jgi:uncharacterized damage-inducible protein DinB
MKDHLAQMLGYEKWANKKILDALKELPAPDEKALELMSHILLVQMVWYSRIVNQSTPPVWDKKSLADLFTLHEENHKVLYAWISKLSEADYYKIIEYKNTKGQPFENTIKDILTHLFNHSTYHRGQIVERMKGKLPKMPETDFIVFFRE